MKKTSSLLAIALTWFTLAALTGCKPSETPPVTPSGETKQAAPASATAAEKNSFHEVTAQLDAGGDLYLYLSTEQWLDGLSSKLAGFRGLADAIPDVQDDDRQNIGKVFDVVTRLLKDSGVEDVSGVGMSSIARERGFYHTKFMLHHYKGKGSGFAWTIFGQKPHAFDSLAYLPANTALATFSDLDVGGLWSVIQKQVAQAGIPQAEEQLNKLPALFEGATGLKWDQVLASLGGEFGFVLTLDDAKPITIPLPFGEPLEIAEPGLMLVARIKNETIFSRLDQALQDSGQQVVKVDKPDLKMRTVPIPLPLPILLRPTVASSGGYLFIGTSDALIQEALAVKAGQKPGLKSTAEFQRLSKDVPQQGNAFSFVSQRLGKTLVQVQKQALNIAGQAQPAQQKFFQSLLTQTNANFSFHVSANTDEGWLSVGNGDQPAGKMLLVGAAVPVAVLAGVALPAFAKAKAAAQKAKEEK
jgi:hypothetical protein